MNATAQVIVAEGRTPKRDLALPAGDSNIMTVIAAAARDPQVDPDKMLKLYEIRERELTRLARSAYADAMAAFKANPPKIIKDKHVKIAHKQGGGFTEYDHATLGHVCDQIIAGLATVGIAHRWDLAQLDGGMIRVTCVLTHRDGHSESVFLQSSRDDSGSKNNIQAVGSTVTYLQRYTLLSATGLATGVSDDDGQRSDPIQYLSHDQAANLQALVEEVGANRVNFLAYFKAEYIEDIPAANYKEAVRMLEAKRKQVRR